MPGNWTISSWPRCTHHVFLSHCAEDRTRLVTPVRDILAQQGCLAWIDARDYPPGRDSFEVLREELLHCRHVIYFVTSKMLQQGRAWTGIEKGYGALLQQNLRYGANDICHIELPLFFLPQGHPDLMRSAYAPVIHKGRFHPAGRVTAAAGRWAAEEILRFVRNEQLWAAQIAQQMQHDPLMMKHFSADKNLQRRLRAEDPLSVP